MDQTTHELRLSNWKAIIDSCQARPDGQTARQWRRVGHGVVIEQPLALLAAVHQLFFAVLDVCRVFTSELAGG